MIEEVLCVAVKPLRLELCVPLAFNQPGVDAEAIARSLDTSLECIAHTPFATNLIGANYEPEVLEQEDATLTKRVHCLPRAPECSEMCRNL